MSDHYGPSYGEDLDTMPLSWGSKLGCMVLIVLALGGVLWLILR